MDKVLRAPKLVRFSCKTSDDGTGEMVYCWEDKGEEAKRVVFPDKWLITTRIANIGGLLVLVEKRSDGVDGYQAIPLMWRGLGYYEDAYRDPTFSSYDSKLHDLFYTWCKKEGLWQSTRTVPHRCWSVKEILDVLPQTWPLSLVREVMMW